MPIRLLVADVSNVCLYGIQAMLKSAPDFAVVATTRDGEAAVQLALSLRPDILLLDIGLHGVNGIAVMARVHYADPSIRGVFFTERQGERWERLGLESGAVAWMSKDVEDAMFLRVLRDVAAGRRPPRSATAHLGVLHAGREVAPLSPREIAVLRHAVRGLTSKEIGALIDCKHRTVDKHLESIRHKFGVAHPRAILPIGLLHLRYLDLLAEDAHAAASLTGAGVQPGTPDPDLDGPADPGPDDGLHPERN